MKNILVNRIFFYAALYISRSTAKATAHATAATHSKFFSLYAIKSAASVPAIAEGSCETDVKTAGNVIAPNTLYGT